MKKYYAGIDIGGTSAKICMYSVDGENDALELKWSIPTNREDGSGVILKSLADTVNDKCTEYGIKMADIAGIGIGIPGPVTEDGTVLGCANLNFGIVPIRNIMAKLTGIDNVVVGNDANVAALGEMWKGGARGFKDVIMVTLGTGVGGGLVLDGRIHVGSKGAAAEIGHMTVEPGEQDICGCGCRGCLEQYASATGVVRLARQGYDFHTGSVLYGKEITAKDIFDAAKENDAYALEVVDRFAKYLGLALSNIAAVVDPEVFLIGGGVSAAGDIIIDNVKDYYEMYSMKALKGREIRLATLGNDAGILGCVKMAIDGDICEV